MLRNHPEELLEQIDDSLPIDFMEIVGELVLTTQVAFPLDRVGVTCLR
jgi:hypothetical protein